MGDVEIRVSQGQEQREIGVHDNDPMAMLLYAIRAEETRRQYLSKLKAFFDYLGLQGNMEDQAHQFVSRSTKEPSWAMAQLMRFISFQKERVTKKEITEATLRNYYKPIKLFCEMNDIQLSWKKIARGMPRARSASNDRAPTIEEIRALLNYPDRRMRPIICTMVSSGIRLGAWDYLRWGDVEPIFKGDTIIAAKLVVYRGDAEEYFTFITPEAYDTLKAWMRHREQAGERVNKNSWLMRDLWNAEHYHHAFISHPKPLKSSGIKRLMERALWAQGIRKPLEEGSKRHEFKVDHGFRKYFKTRAEQVMRPINVEIIMGHSVGLSDSYYRPTEHEMLEDYLKAVELLTVDEKRQLQNKVDELATRQPSEDEKDRKIEYLTRKQEQFELWLDSLIESGHLPPKPDFKISSG